MPLLQYVCAFVIISTCGSLSLFADAIVRHYYVFPQITDLLRLFKGFYEGNASHALIVNYHDYITVGQEYRILFISNSQVS